MASKFPRSQSSLVGRQTVEQIHEAEAEVTMTRCILGTSFTIIQCARITAT